MSTIAGVSGGRRPGTIRERPAGDHVAARLSADRIASPPFTGRPGVAVIATGALLGWFVVEQLSSTTPVVAWRATSRRGR